MSAPNIEMITDSLRNCSIRGRSRGVRSPPAGRRSGGEGTEVTVELNSEVALPYHWEQCLDMRTGEIYYRNWRTGRRTTEDPRFAGNFSYYSTSSDNDSSDSDDDDNSSNEGSNKDSFFGSGGFSSGGDDSSSSSSASSWLAATSADPRVLVAAGCKSCFMYFMVPKQDFACPKCGRLLLHLGLQA